jgi:anti-anti-sigma factor
MAVSLDTAGGVTDVCTEPLRAEPFVLKIPWAYCDVEQAARLRKLCIDAVNTAKAPVLIMDLVDVRLLDAMCIGVILGMRTRLQDMNRELRLAGTQQTVLRSMTALGLDRVLPTYDSVEAARI